MAISIDLFKAQLDSLIDALDAEISDHRRYQAVQAAVERYSVDAPDTYTEDVTGDGGRYYPIATSLGNWVEEFSRVIEIEYPAADISADETPQYLDPEDFRDDYWQEVGAPVVHTRYLYLPAHTPAGTETMRIRYTLPYSWAVGGTAVAVAQNSHGLAVDDYIYNDGTNWVATTGESVFQATAQVTAAPDSDNFSYKILYVDVPTKDFFAICSLAACVACQWLAARYAKASDGIIGADSTAHTTRSSEFASRSREFCDTYKSHMGLDRERVVQGAGTFIDWDSRPSHRGRETWVFHNDVRQGRRGNRR